MYNGHKDWAHWNVSLWLYNDQDMYNLMVFEAKKARSRVDAARHIMNAIIGGYRVPLKTGYRLEGDKALTPDGAVYTAARIYEALEGFEW